jgi:hypothetical protein
LKADRYVGGGHLANPGQCHTREWNVLGATTAREIRVSLISTFHRDRPRLSGFTDAFAGE